MWNETRGWGWGWQAEPDEAIQNVTRIDLGVLPDPATISDVLAQIAGGHRPGPGPARAYRDSEAEDDFEHQLAQYH